MTQIFAIRQLGTRNKIANYFTESGIGDFAIVRPDAHNCEQSDKTMRDCNGQASPSFASLISKYLLGILVLDLRFLKVTPCSK